MFLLDVENVVGNVSVYRASDIKFTLSLNHVSDHKILVTVYIIYTKD